MFVCETQTAILFTAENPIALHNDAHILNFGSLIVVYVRVLLKKSSLRSHKKTDVIFGLIFAFFIRALTDTPNVQVILGSFGALPCFAKMLFLHPSFF